MAVFALFGIVPVFLYCLIQTIRDYRRREVIMTVWGLLLCGVSAWMIVSVFRNPGY